MSSPIKKTCWVLTNTYTGTKNQAMGLAQTIQRHLPDIELSITVKVVKLRPFWYYTAPYISLLKGYSWDVSITTLQSPWPDYVIACGRQSVLPALFIKEQWEKERNDNHDAAKHALIFLQNPLYHHEKFDAIACPAHDHLKGENVHPMIGAPHLLTEEKLQSAFTAFAPCFETAPSPRIAVILGGPNTYYDMDLSFAKQLCTHLHTLHTQHGASLLITTSRRTPKSIVEYVKTHMPQQSFFYTPDDTTHDNPYIGILAWADHILVTCESISMVSEACFTTKPVYLLDLPKKKNALRTLTSWIKKSLGMHQGGLVKFEDFQHSLITLGRAQWFEGGINPTNAPCIPLRETERIARKILPLFQS